MDCKEDGSYVLSGGVGALGLVTAEMMAQEGAKSLVLLSRRGVIGSEMQAQWEKLEKWAVDLQVKACDVGKMSAVHELLAGLRGDLAASKKVLPLVISIHIYIYMYMYIYIYICICMYIYIWREM